MSIRYDDNSYSLFLDSNTVTLSTLAPKRLKCNFNISDYHQKYFTDWDHRSAELCIDKNSVFLHIVFEKEIPETIYNGRIIGIDRGINNLAVTSDNKFYRRL